LVTFIGSSYSIVLRYQTPVAVSDRLRRDWFLIKLISG
jgi:hypothetical protein